MSSLNFEQSLYLLTLCVRGAPRSERVKALRRCLHPSARPRPSHNHSTPRWHSRVKRLERRVDKREEARFDLSQWVEYLQELELEQIAERQELANELLDKIAGHDEDWFDPDEPFQAAGWADMDDYIDDDSDLYCPACNHDPTDCESCLAFDAEMSKVWS